MKKKENSENNVQLKKRKNQKQLENEGNKIKNNLQVKKERKNEKQRKKIL